MQTRPLGQSGIQASVVGLGTWGIGGWMWGGTDEQASIRAIQASIDAGVTLIDTAPAYGLGLSEELVGQALVGRRDQVILATKCGLTWHNGDGQYFFEENGHAVYRNLRPDAIRHELEQSFKRLKTDYIDLYQTHWQDPTTPIEETMRTLIDLKQEGKIRAIGVSNIAPHELESYWRVGPVNVAQEKYSMLDREMEAELLPLLREKNMALLSYSPLAMGLLTGKIGLDRQFNGDDQRRDDPRFSLESRQRVAELLEEFKPIARAYDLTLAQLVIAWTFHQPGVTHVLCGARNVEQALENAKAGSVSLSEADLSTMSNLLQSFALNPI